MGGEKGDEKLAGGEFISIAPRRRGRKYAQPADEMNSRLSSFYKKGRVTCFDVLPHN